MTAGPTTTATTTGAMTEGGTSDRERRRWPLPPVAVRFRILGFVVALLALAVTAGLLLGRSVLVAQLERDVGADLDQEVEELRQLAIEVDPDTGRPRGADAADLFDTFLDRNIPAAGEAFFTIVDGEPHGTTASPAPLLDDPALLARWSALTTSATGNLETSAGPVRYQAVPVRVDGETAGVFVVAGFLQAAREEIDDFVRTSAVVSALVLLFTAALAWLLAGRILAPIRELTTVATAIGESDLSRRIEVEGNDEVAALARTFNAMLDRLQGAFDTQRAFLDDAGHELRTPITVVRGHLELLDDDPAERAATVALVTDELDRMNRMVNDLLLLAKAERPDFLAPGPLDLDELLGSVDPKARALADDRGWHLDAGFGTFTGDRDRLTQALLNLVGNAVAHTDPGDAITIGGRLEPDAVRLWVTDTGTGIAEEDLPHLFDRFRRGRDAQRRADGAGLGLAIVHAIATAHGGTVAVDSTLGAGTTFTLLLPPDEETDAPHPDR